MKFTKYVLLIGVTLFFCELVNASNSMSYTKSPVGFIKTVEAVEKFIKSKNLKIFAKIDHTGNAKKLNIEMLPNTLFIMGSPRVGGPIMQAYPSFGIDLPVKIHIYQNAKGDILVGYNKPAALAKKHKANTKIPSLLKMTKILGKLDGYIKTLPK